MLPEVEPSRINEPYSLLSDVMLTIPAFSKAPFTLTDPPFFMLSVLPLLIVKNGIYSINDILKLCYADTPLEMHIFAKRNLLLHINKLIAEQKIDQDKLIYD